MTSTGTAADVLRERWRDRSARSTWARPEDWYVPAVEALAEALAEEVVESRGVEAAADRLGRQRADEGVGLGEALDDLTSLYLAAGVLQPPLRVVRALAEGWADAGVAPVRTAGCEDALTGLATPAYLRTRLRETYAAAERDGVPASEIACLVVLDGTLSPVDPLQRMARGMVLAAALSETFHSGEPLAALSSGRVVALVPRDASLGLAVRQLRDAVEARVARAGLAAAVRRPPRVWVEGLPADHTSAVSLLIELER
jgi:hypothetical protein